tara:strand:- start:169 stop:2037 length:1869 start_codon:yes stop_codon:yes gene_type:complete
MIIYIENHKYDVTEFVNEHPGGAEVFNNGADLTKEFNEVGHSKDAIKLLKQYLVEDNTEEPTKEHTKEHTKEATKKKNKQHTKEKINLDEVSIKEFFFHKFSQTKLSRLFTKEDKANLHKILGVFALLNYVYFFFDVGYSGCKGKMTLRKKDANFLFSVIPLALLSLSALMFHTPSASNNTGMPQEYQFHSILFAMRSILIILVITLFGKTTFARILTVAILFATMYAADMISYYFKDTSKKYGAKITSLSFWNECPVLVRNIIKTIYVVAQLTATSAFFAADIELHFVALFIIQLTALLFTLLRKQIISMKGWHLGYLFQYLLVFLLWHNDAKIYKAILIGVICYVVRVHLRVSKYMMWSAYAVIFALVTGKTISFSKVLQLLSLLSIITYVLKSQNKVFDKKRSSNQTTVLKNLKQEKNHCIDIDISPIFKYYPGQHFNLFFNTEKRPYTPIHVSGQQANFFIKNYENGKVSPNICKYYYEKGDVNVLGPFGNKYYDPEKDALMIQDAEVTRKKIIMFCCGTGITPFYSILTNLSKHTKYKCKLYASFKSRADRFLVQDIPKSSAKKRCFYSQEGTRLTKETVEKILSKNKKAVVLVCGTKSYNEMIKSCCGDERICYCW